LSEFKGFTQYLKRFSRRIVVFFPIPIMAYFVSDIIIYPIKSLPGIHLTQTQVERRGLALDRRWVLTDNSFLFISQRKYPQLALLGIEMTENYLYIFQKDNPKSSIKIPFQAETADFQEITIWDDQVTGVRVNDKVDQWFSDFLGFQCHLFYQPDNSIRPIDPKYSITGQEHTSFSDGYPILIIGEESLTKLNQKLSQPITMNRFRPNIIFSGGIAHDEDNWKLFSINSTKMAAVKLCARCNMININPINAESGKEPLQTLSHYRKTNNKVLFGNNVVVLENGLIRLGDEIILG